MTQSDFQMPAILQEGARRVPPPRPAPRLGRLRRRHLWAIIALLVAVASVAAVLWIRNPLSELSEADLRAARLRWREAGIDDYDLRLAVAVSGTEPSEYLVKVRDGRVSELSRNGQPAASHSARDFTVEGLFDTLARELEMKQSAGEGFGGAAAGVLLRVRFDERLGFVRHYVRVVGGTARSSEIKVLEFRRPK